MITCSETERLNLYGNVFNYNKTMLRITRLEVIGNSRLYVNNNVKGLTISIQDEGRTMKVFIDE